MGWGTCGPDSGAHDEGGTREPGEARKVRGVGGPGTGRPSVRMGQGAGARKVGKGAARACDCRGVNGPGARGTATFEVLEALLNARAIALVRASAEDGQRERTGRGGGQAGGAKRAAAAIAVAHLRARGVTARWRYARARRTPGRRQRVRARVVRAQARIGVVEPRVAPVRARRSRHLARGVGGRARGTQAAVLGTARGVPSWSHVQREKPRLARARAFEVAAHGCAVRRSRDEVRDGKGALEGGDRVHAGQVETGARVGRREHRTREHGRSDHDQRSRSHGFTWMMGRWDDGPDSRSSRFSRELARLAAARKHTSELDAAKHRPGTRAMYHDPAKSSGIPCKLEEARLSRRRGARCKTA